MKKTLKYTVLNRHWPARPKNFDSLKTFSRFLHGFSLKTTRATNIVIIVRFLPLRCLPSRFESQADMQNGSDEIVRIRESCAGHRCSKFDTVIAKTFVREGTKTTNKCCLLGSGLSTQPMRSSFLSEFAISIVFILLVVVLWVVVLLNVVFWCFHFREMLFFVFPVP